MFALHAILPLSGPWISWGRIAALGAVQGLTEFLPVSSSGHLVLFEHLLGVHRPGLALETGLHLGTLAAVLWEFRSDLRAAVGGLVDALRRRPGPQPGAGLLGWLVAASLPAAAVGLLAGGLAERLFGSLPATAGAWCLSGLMLMAAGRIPPGRRTLERLRLGDALWIGAAQALALAPGVSRSGATIAAGIARGLAPAEATRFAFLLSLPAVGGAALLHGGRLLAAAGEGGAIWVGAGVAGATGLFAIRACAARVRAGGLGSFGCYCLALGVLVLLRGALTGEWR